MSTKTYNMGRVVGWSSYEEFLKENPNVDPSIVTSKVYSTMVTYGVTRKLFLPVSANRWKPAQGTDSTFYITTQKVSGAVFGAVPIVGIWYDAYMSFDSVQNYADAPASAGTTKELLDKAFSCIFTCYVSDENGNKTTDSSHADGYLTFAAYPDIIQYLECVAELQPSGQGFPVIVRGLGLEGLDDVGSISGGVYFGPQGIVVGTGGVSDPKYCEQDTIDISALCLNASGYIWMNNGGNVKYHDQTTLVSLTSHPRGDLLISTFGYLSSDLMEATGDFEDKHYAFTYAEYQEVVATPGFSFITSQVDAIDSNSRDDYVYMFYGQPSYEAPPSGQPMYVAPVRKSDYYMNIGDFDGFNTNRTVNNQEVSTLEKPLDLTYTVYDAEAPEGRDYKAVILIPNRATAKYVGSYWEAPLPSESKVVYWGNGSLREECWLDGEYATGQPNHGRTTAIVSVDLAWVPKGDYIIIQTIAMSEKYMHGLYQHVCDEHNANLFVRRGAYINMSVPSWATEKDYWKVDLSSQTATIEDGVLYVNNKPVYPGELLVIGTKDSFSTYLVLNTVMGSNIELIVSKSCEFTLDISGAYSVNSRVDHNTDFIAVLIEDIEDIIQSTSVNVWTDASNAYSFTLTNTDFTPGILFNIRHQEVGVYGYNKWYRYILQYNDHGAYMFGSGMVWTENPTLSVVAGHPGRYNSAFPTYGQQLPDADNSYYYNVPAVLSHTPAKKMFEDFGADITEYVHEDFQNLSLGKFLQECVIRNDLTVAPTSATLRDIGISTDYHMYAKEDMNYTSGHVPTPTAANPISASLTMSANTSAKSYFSTAYYTAVLTKNGQTKSVAINNPDYPIWASVSKSPEGTEIVSVSVTDNSGSQLDFSGNSGTIEADTVTWLDMLVGLGSGKSVDVLKGARFGKGANDCTYIETAEGTRLYISATEPTGDIPEGSIGIGW